jgi:beta-glucanase (GH16 family)
MRYFSRFSLSTLVFLAIVVTACGGSGDGSAPPDNPPPVGQWTLVWSDEFDGTNGSSPSSTNWVMETGGGGWGNNELESYTARTENASIQDGNLVITARKEPYTGTDGIARDYTSARMKTQGKFSWKYGKVEARIKIPYGQGIWPAFWMLGDDITTVSWPTCGEVDIMENIGREPSIVHGTIHGPGYSGAN